MTKAVVVSLGRILADRIRVEPGEACAVVEHVWRWLQRTAGADADAVPALPHLDTLGITAFGDFEVRTSKVLRSRQPRPPADVATELASLLLRLVASGRAELDGQAATCAVIARRALRSAASGADVDADAQPIAAPGHFLDALAPFQPADASAALSALYARWMRTTDSAHAPAWQAVVGESPRPVVEPTSLDATPAGRDRSGPAPAASSSRLVPSRPRRDRRPTAWLAAAAAILVAFVLGWGAVRWYVHRPVERAEPEPALSQAAPASSPQQSPRQATSVADADVSPVTVRTRAATPPRRLLHAAVTGRVPYSPSFDPRTRGLVFHTGLERTALVEAALTEDGQVTAVRTLRDDGSRAFHAQVSPDGTRLAFDSDIDGTRGVYVAQRDGSAPERVSGAGEASVPTWSPDGETIAFTRAEPGRPRVWNVWTVHLPTGRLQRETHHRVGQAWGASWFPDGRRFAYSVEDRLVVLDRETGRRRTWPSPVRGQLVRTPAVSPDGRRILFQVYRDGAWLLDLEEGTTRRILDDRSAQEFAWAPDGQRVAYHSVRGGAWGIWLMDVRG